MFTVAPIFQDHCVLQRDTLIPVWGRARPMETIRARLGDFPAATTTANEDGSWLLRLPAVGAGGPFELLLETGSGQSLTVKDLLVGDVWVCSGQSNMEWKLSQCDTHPEETARADHPHLRLLTIATPAKADPQTSVGGPWLTCTPSTISAFSAVGGWFGRKLHAELGIPIGLIANAWGGTRIEAWLSRQALMTDPLGPALVTAYEEQLYGLRPMDGPCYVHADDWFQAEGPEDPVNHGEKQGWHRPDFNDAAWSSMDIPCRWQDRGHDFNGIFWFRRNVELPKDWRGRSLVLHLGAIDKHDETYVNGVKVGGMSWENRDAWCTPRTYSLPPELTTGERLTLAVRVRSHLYHGGMTGPASVMGLASAATSRESISLAGPWKFAVEQNWGLVKPPPLTTSGEGPGGHNAPYTLFNSRLHPIIPYAIRGFIWYQGESNTANPTAYRRLLPLLIQDWRRHFAQGDLPFLIVQLANYMAAYEEPRESAWAELREAQRAALALPATGLAVAIDVGEANDIHPRAKKPVGERLARWALAHVYHRPILPSGPLFRSLQAEPYGRLRVCFDYALGLRTRDGQPVRHVAVAPADGPFRWAETAIEGETLLAWHPDIPHPQRLRYAWADNPAGCNLVNGEDLPASPFQASLGQP
ncbi:MAG: sialate O-acetylesterase [Candidatus Methylacidiphilales bacterium]